MTFKGQLICLHVSECLLVTAQVFTEEVILKEGAVGLTGSCGAPFPSPELRSLFSQELGWDDTEGLQRVETGKTPLVPLLRTWHSRVEQDVDGRVPWGKYTKWHQGTFGLERDRKTKEVREGADSLRGCGELWKCVQWG